MTRDLRVRAETWPLVRPFAIARGTKTEARVVVAEIEDDGIVGRGECVPYTRYGETVEGVVQAIEAFSPTIARGIDRIALNEAVPAGAARNALDCALWDLEAKQRGQRAWDIAGLTSPLPRITATTISLGSAEAMAEDARRLDGCPGCPLVKIKLDREAIVERVAAVRAAAPRARLIVDANEAWDGPLLLQVIDGLARLGVELIEQPLPTGKDAVLAGFTPPLVLVADESCHTIEDLDHLADRYQGINIKLDKAGGLSRALTLAREASDRRLRVMIGCMVSTSLGIAPATLLTPFADILDLDGPLWLARDREPPLSFAGGFIHPPEPELWG
jgi:L-alanine-DL-glutamate epimerase-like enolase superfamily enzyme